MSNLINGLDQWNETLTEKFCPMSCTSLSTNKPMDFNGNLVSRRLHKANISQVSSSPIKVSRTKLDTSKMSEAYYLIKFQMKGQGTVRHYNREANLKVGDFVICSTTEPYELEFQHDYQQTVFSIPHQTLQEMFSSPDDLLGIRMANEFPLNGILSQFVYSLTQRIDLLEPETLHSMEANVLNLLITSLKAEQKVKVKAVDTSPEKHMQQIKRFISLNIKDYRLSVDFIAQAENISKRYLHMLFKNLDVSVSKYIQQLRLEGCYNDLTNAEFNHISTSDIAFDWGFGDVSHFYRCFKSEYLLTPRQIRLQAGD